MGNCAMFLKMIGKGGHLRLVSGSACFQVLSIFFTVHSFVRESSYFGS